MTREQKLEIFKKASLIRAFEDKLFQLIKQGLFKYPIYLSAGSEHIMATLAVYCQDIKPLIFAQHRCHGVYLAFNGDIDELIDELLGKETGCCKGMGGSASIQSKENNFFGHCGFMGSQVPIAVGACLQTKKFTIAICGDASLESDYVMTAVSWSKKQNLPILFVVVNNKLSILTHISVRRDWKTEDFARSVLVNAEGIEDKPEEIWAVLERNDLPLLLDINTDRLYFHGGAGIDPGEKRDRFKLEMIEIGQEAEEIHKQNIEFVEEKWRKHLDK